MNETEKFYDGAPSAKSISAVMLMRLLQQFISALQAELYAWRRALSAWQLYTLLIVLLGGLLVAIQLPLHYHIDVGVGEGYGGDLPMLQGFNDAEHDEHGSYRWTTDEARIMLPGVGVRPLLVQLHFFPVGAQVMAVGPKEIEIWSNAERLATLPVRPEGASYSLPIPTEATANGDLTLTIHTATFAPGGDDPRRLGTPLNQIEVTSLTAPSIAWPNWQATAAWLGTALIIWALVLRAGFAPREALLLAGTGVAFALLAATLDPPRLAFGALPALTTAALAYGLVVALRAVLIWSSSRRSVYQLPLDDAALRWLLLIVALAFGLRYGGRLYPESMGGDIGFHYNRMTEVIKGRIFILSRNRGVDFPYPPGPYIALLPFTLLGIDPRIVLQLGAALVEALSAVLVYALVARHETRDTRREMRDERKGKKMVEAPLIAHHSSLVTRHSLPLLAAAIYVFTAAGFMTTWWSFDTHIYTQFVTLLLITVVVLGLSDDETRKMKDERQKYEAFLRLSSFVCVLLAAVFLGHFGFFINTALLGGGLLVVVWLVAWRGIGWARVIWRPLTLAYAGALITALLFFYSAFAPLLIAQIQAAASGGLTGLAQREPVPRWVLWQVLWEAGFIVHFGFFPLMLAPVGLWMGWRRKTKDERRRSDLRLSFVLRPKSVLFALAAGSFLVSSLFAVLPFITQSTQSTRWLMFSAWAVAITAAVAAQRLWRYGWIGKLVVLAMAGFVIWNTTSLWLGALAWRIRPPEPF